MHTATAVHADEEGLFDEQGLDVTLEQTSGGAQAIPSLIAGEYDITYGNYTSALLAAQQGLPIRIIAGNDVGADDHGIMVNEDSPFQEPADLEGARVAVNNLQNIGTVAVRAVLEDAGVDSSTVTFVELPLPDMQGALDAGDVDAIWQVEPFQASSLANGDRMLFPSSAARWTTCPWPAGSPRNSSSRRTRTPSRRSGRRCPTRSTCCRTTASDSWNWCPPTPRCPPRWWSRWGCRNGTPSRTRSSCRRWRT
ncbi:ABC transporter substrate-binding protein [Blastococcus brunescens]|uniref:ABC transporter substrate-binding protein n=1 Tax=Blastococcus brunescens TaxID=1564165 RepID=A0ABZ1B8J3_9ACTN|nr:ABC transporter substrate-binding protein [Blastococcus sp. BMG 8361]WRL66692.1 ABC transporter substrate-binding protein [Blastococcus sp. BMG 8361]